MVYAAASGLTLPFSEKTEPKSVPIEVGQRSRGTRSAPRKNVRETYEAWDLVTPDIEVNVARALQKLFHGRGHVFHFIKNLHSFSGLRPTAATMKNVTFSPGTGLNDGEIIVAGSSQLDIPAGLGSTWTIWVRRHTGAGWSVYGEDSEGNQWVNGVSTAFTNSWFSVSSGTVELLGSTRFDEVVILDWVAPSLFMEAWTALTVPFSPLPSISITGDIGTFLARCDVEELEESDKVGYARQQVTLKEQLQI